MATIFTFYSYKGGTGRSMALANVAWILATNDRRVLVVDWDLEAPGLHHYFRPFLRDPDLLAYDVRGVIDLVFEYASMAVTPPASSEQPRPPDWYLPYADITQCAIPLCWSSGERVRFGRNGGIDLVPAGRQVPQVYANRVNGFDWSRFYAAQSGGAFIDAVRESMRGYDYVLIDSRTGVSDTAGICTVQMPDALVLCFTLNNQSIRGTAGVAASLAARRNSKPIYPVPMRVDPFEKDRLNRRRDYAHHVFADTMAALLPTLRVPVERYWEEVELPYFASYAYEELLAPFEKYSGSVGSMLPALERLTGHLTQGKVAGLGKRPEESRRAEIMEAYERTGTVATSATRPRSRWRGLSAVVASAVWSVVVAGIVLGTRQLLAPQPAVVRPPILASIATSVPGAVITWVPAADQLDIVDVVPVSMSREQRQDSEPVLAVHPDGGLMVAAALTGAGQGTASPLFVSSDAGREWRAMEGLPDRVSSQDYAFSADGATLFGAIFTEHRVDTLAIDGLPRELKLGSPAGQLTAQGDNPSVEADPKSGSDFYVGLNDFSTSGGRTATVAMLNVGKAGDRTVTETVRVEKRTTQGQDGPQVPLAAHADGTVYAAFFRWTKVDGEFGANSLVVTADVVVVRDKRDITGPFSSLVDREDGRTGVRVARDIHYPFMRNGTPSTGNQRLNGSLALAVDPRDSARVYLAWADTEPAPGALMLHVRESIDGGRTWSDDIVGVPGGTNGALAVATDGSVGLFFQQFVTEGDDDRWETHLRIRRPASDFWQDVRLNRFRLRDSPVKQFEPFLAGKGSLVAVHRSFYGVFAAPNLVERRTGDPPVRFLRRVEESELVGESREPVATSIDPFFFCVSLAGSCGRSAATH